MELIDEGERFRLDTSKNRKDAMKIVRNCIKNGVTDRGRIVNKLHKNVYAQRKDCKDFIKNICRAKGIYVHYVGSREIGLGKESEVTV